ncbi:hypothetical protein VNI00_016945 [Paramarasmius palmivorus]|uniref:Uncharacterized protein n=1 Tax=Paramarasmius palmivorus TaxID=297713 RepID=A0AAW0BAQ5_9AGAR
MPRPKKLHNERQRRQAARINSAKYYARNRERIKQHKRDVRAHLKEAEAQSRKERHERRLREKEEQHRRNLKQAHLIGDTERKKSPIWSIRCLANVVHKETNGNAAHLLDRYVERFLRWSELDAFTRQPVSPLAPLFGTFRPLLETVEQLSEDILQAQGCSNEYSEASSLYSTLMRIVDALEQVELLYSNGTGTFGQKYSEGALLFQQQLWRAAVNGVKGLAAWSYTG